MTFKSILQALEGGGGRS